MIPTYNYSVSSSPMPLDLNEDHTHHLFSPNLQASSSSSSLSYSILFNSDQDQGRSYYWEEPKQLQSDEEAEKITPSSGSWDHPAVEKDGNNSDLKLKVLKKEDGNENLEAEDHSMKWMPSKKRMMFRMMVSDQTGSDITDISEQHKYEKQKLQQLSPVGTDNSSNNYSNRSNITVRVCADCQTTKTPLWRSGPRGPKSLCNACGIRQRKARRALAAAAAASADGTILVATDQNKLQSKGKKRSKTESAQPQLKKKRKLGGRRGRKMFSFEDLTISLSKNLALQQVSPRDEKEAAILLMALSYGLLHGFPSDRYLDS